MKYIIRYRICIAGSAYAPGEAHAKIVKVADDYQPQRHGSVQDWTYNEHDETFPSREKAIEFAKNEPQMSYTQIYDVTDYTEARWQAEWSGMIWTRK